MALVIKGYKALALPLPAAPRRSAAAAGEGNDGADIGPEGASPFAGFIYVRQHSSKGYVRARPIHPIGR